MVSLLQKLARLGTMTTRHQAPGRTGDRVLDPSTRVERPPNGQFHTRTVASTVLAGIVASRLGSTFGSLAVRDFRYLWLGSFASQLGMWVQQVAVGWLAYDLTGSATFLGVVVTARSLSSVALTL